MTGTVTATTTQPVGKQSRERIVVGVDGSKASTDALRWAARQAELMGALLEVVMVWEMPVNPWASSVPSGEDFATRARRVLRKTVVDVLGEPPETDVVAIATRGRPVPALLDAAKGADLLVVGSRGHGAFIGVLLGSVSEQCIGRAPCPVVVVRSCPHGQPRAPNDEAHLNVRTIATQPPI